MVTNVSKETRAEVGKHVVLVQHEGIPTRDADRARDFYMRVFGLQVLPRPPLPAPGYWLGTPGGFPQIHIILCDSPVPGSDAPIDPVGRHVCFEVADFEAFKRTLEQEGIKYLEAPVIGRPQLWINDPDGHTLEFQQAG